MINDPEYLKLMVRQIIKETRYVHSLGVAQTAKELAECHQVDPQKAYIAGILHDCTKYLSEAEHDAYLRYYDPDKVAYPLSVKHSFSAPYFLKEKLNFHDKDILNAIYNHTICTSHDRLSLILYIADKREPGRNIDDDILLIAHKDLYKAFELCSADVENYIKGKRNERFIGNSI